MRLKLREVRIIRKRMKRIKDKDRRYAAADPYQPEG